MTAHPALEARGIFKRFGERDALRGVDLVVEAGRLHGLLGPNGAGKTTLMRVALGLVRSDAGTLRLLGRETGGTAGPLPSGVAGFVDAPAFYPYLSARKNLALLARLDSIDGARCSGEPDALLEQVGLGAHAHVVVGAFSAGMRQRLGLAAALLRKPQLLVLDEPTSALDAAGSRDVRTLARRLAAEGVAILFSSHDMAEVEELCSTVTILNHGQVVCSSAVEDLRRRSPAVIHAMRTSDDGAALCVASDRPAISVVPVDDGLEISADLEELDAYVLALGRAGIAIRQLIRRTRSLESFFLELTRSAEVVNTSPRLPRETTESRGASLVAS